MTPIDLVDQSLSFLAARLPILWTVFSIPIVWLIYRWSSGPTRLPYPPGPKPSLFVGNIKDFPATKAWLIFAQWKQVYGDIIHLELLGQHYIILNSLEAAKELLEKRSAIYSERPRYILMEIMGFHKITGFLPYGTAWRRHRNMFQNAMIRSNGLHLLRPIHADKVKDLLNNLLISPKDYLGHSKTLSAAIILAAVYGHDIVTQDDTIVEVAEVVMTKISKLMVSTSSLMMNSFPFIRFVPSWFPGAGAKRKALEGKKEVRRMLDVPFEMVEKQLKEGTAKPSIVSNLLRNRKPEEDPDLIKEMAGAAYGAGADTTAATLGIFYYLMLLHPTVQAKAQQELDSVVGSYRLPTFDDQALLPYISALLKEVLRWMPVGPLGVFHCVKRDDVYRSYYIPKGANIVSNIWAINHDPNMYPDPEKFNPERFLNEDGSIRDDLEVRSFGFGRRICVGQNIASDVLWLTMASVLHTFNIQPKKDPSGQDIIPEAKYNEGAVVRIIPFECSITPRSKISVQLITTATLMKDD